MWETGLKRLATFLGLLVLLNLERTWGVPVLFFAFSSMWLSDFSYSWLQIIASVLLGFLLAIVYVVPFSVGVAILAWIWVGTVYGPEIVTSQTLRLLGLVIGSLVVLMIFSPMSWGWNSGLIALVSVSMIMFSQKAAFFWDRGRASQVRIPWSKHV